MPGVPQDNQVSMVKSASFFNIIPAQAGIHLPLKNQGAEKIKFSTGRQKPAENIKDKQAIKSKVSIYKHG